MRQHVLAVVLVAFVVAAFAQEGQQLRPLVQVPGREAFEEFSVDEKVMSDDWEMTESDREKVKQKVAELNRDRKDLLEQLEAAGKKPDAAPREIDGIAVKLRKQEDELYAYIKERVRRDLRDDFEVRVRLMPLVRWLALSDQQAEQLTSARKELLRDFGGNPAELIAAKAAQGFPEEGLSADQRKEYIELASKYRDFSAQWIQKVESVLTDEQKELWRNRYRCTKETIREGL